MSQSDQPDTRFYAGIGSRETPSEFLHVAHGLAEKLQSSGWTLRSGHAPGADQAFEKGAHGSAELFLPWNRFEAETPLQAKVVLHEPTLPAYELAAKYHPAWVRLSRGSKALHARNVHQVLGMYLNHPVTFIVCWTPGGKEVGGTAQAMRIAKAYEIPIFNLAIPEDINAVTQFINPRNLK